MKVYAIKRNDGKYKTETSEYLKEIWFSELFNDYETALCYCPSDCKIIECELMENTELADREKQVRKQVCDEIREKVIDFIERKGYKTGSLCNFEYANGYCYGLQYDLAKILDQIEKRIN